MPHGNDENRPLLPNSRDDSNESQQWTAPRRSNVWMSFKHTWKDELAEFWGAFMIVLFGAAAECQVHLHYNSRTVDAEGGGADGQFGSYLSTPIGWAIGVATAVWMSGGISGGHCNPGVTLAMTLFRKFPVKKVPGYIVAQILGATVAALVVYTNYYSSISVFEGGSERTVVGPHATAGMFFTMPAGHLSAASAMFSEFVGSAILVGMIFALTDKNNMSVPAGALPFAIFLVILGIGSSFGVNTGYAVNFARDFGPRVALTIVGYGSDIWTHDGGYWLWSPCIATIAGASFGAFLYDASIYMGADSPLVPAVNI
ncbi:aquaporin-like protein [Stachybotrys elegans]|uniref:Aquaporin-like protein n=1 Tax=Stachybotrys elegans TaxID=80388 RepID=A0A8K0SCE3_9HYPO|nr:aquaporin-like protein [Stachybotrys elegans]